MNKVRIEAPDLKEAFERVSNDVQRQITAIEAEHRRRKVIMWCSLIVAAASLTLAVIKCLN